MRLLRHLAFALSSAWQSFWRNAAVSFAAVVSIALILGLAGVNLVIGHALAGVLTNYESRVSVMNIAIADGMPLATVQDFADKLSTDPRVASVRLVTKDEAFNHFASDPRNREVVTEIEGNPLSAKLEVHVHRLADLAAVDAVARAWPGADPTDPTDYQGDFISRVATLGRWLAAGGVLVMLILTVASVVIVMNTIRTAVYHRRKEIEVMKLVGATEWFVRWPFLLEGMFTGLLAAALALAVLLATYRPAVDRLRSQLFFIPLSYDPKFVAALGTDLFVAGALLGILGSYIGVRRFVRL